MEGRAHALTRSAPIVTRSDPYGAEMSYNFDMLSYRVSRRFASSTAIGLVAAVLLLLCTSCSDSSTLPGSALSPAQQASVESAIGLMKSKGLISFVKLATQIDNAGKWRAALPDDQYLAASQSSGDTPYAYTLPDSAHPHQPIAVVLAPRFFGEADQRAEAALMIHEMGHWMAFVKTGQSTEYDGYKTEFDNHKKIGLTSDDGLTYFSMLDGVEQNVVPRDKSYAKQPEIIAYNKE